MSETPRAYAPQPPAPLSPADQRLWATLIHIGALLLGFWPSLIGYLVLRDRGEFIRQHTRTALNFHITMLIVIVVGSILTIVLIGILVVAAAYIVILIFSIMGAVAANRGEPFKYPLTYEFIK